MTDTTPITAAANPPTRRLSPGSRLAAQITGSSQDALREAPDDEIRVVRLVAMVMFLVMALAFCGWTVALAIARGGLDWVVLPFSLLPGLILYAIDRAMGRWIWTQAGRRVAEARGFSAGGGPVIWARLAHLCLRLLVSGILSVTLAQFLGVGLFHTDAQADMMQKNQALNRPLMQAATERVDALIAARTDEIAQLDEQAAALLAGAERAFATGQMPMDDLMQERAALVDRIADLQSEIDCYTQDIDAEFHGQTRCDGTVAEKGDGDRYNFAKARADSALAERDLARTRIQEIDAALTVLRRTAQGGPDAATQDQLSRLAMRRAQLMQEVEQLTADRPAAIAAQMTADPGYVPPAAGLIQTGEALERLKARSDWMWWSVHLVLASLLILDLGVVIVLTLLPPPPFIVLFEVLDGETLIQAALARAETSIAASMEQRMQAQVNRAQAERRARDQVVDLHSRANLHDAFSELMDRLGRDEIDKVG